MTDSIIISAEKKIFYISTKVGNAAREALILLAKTISKLIFRIQFFFTDNESEQKTLTDRVSKVLDGGEASLSSILKRNKKNLGLKIINDFYFCTSNNLCISNIGKVSKAFRGTWDILKISF